MKIQILLLVFLFCNAFGMDVAPVVKPVVKNAGPFDLLPQELNKQIFTSLKPKDINSLRKVCYKFGQIFSFVNPSMIFLSSYNRNMDHYDIQGIIFSAVSDGNIEVANLLTKATRSFSRIAFIGAKEEYLINGTGWHLRFLIESDSQTKQVTYRFDTVNEYTIRPYPLLIACIARNNCRVEEIINEPNFVMEVVQEDIESDVFPIYVAIDNGDFKSLSAMFNCKKFLKGIKRYGHILLQRTIYRHNLEMFKFLLGSNYCDINEKKKDMISEWSYSLKEKNNDQVSLLEVVNRHSYLNYFQNHFIILKLLKEKKVAH